jgi:hypothetical protein
MLINNPQHAVSLLQAHLVLLALKETIYMVSTHGKIGYPVRYMAESVPVRPSSSYGHPAPESRDVSQPRECPRCHSDDVKRSRRRLIERALLPLMRAQVYRCCDCKKRFWVGDQLRLVMLGLVGAAVIAAFVATFMFAHETRGEAAATDSEPRVEQRYEAPRESLPKGLPPLSSVPRPADDPEPGKTRR